MIKHSSNSILFFTPAIGWGILICYFSLLPKAEVPQLLQSMQDYLLHFGIYAALSILGTLGYNRFTTSSIPKNRLINIAVFCSVLGVLLEVVQETLVPGRHFQWSDVIANTLGVFIVLPINRYLLK